MSVAPRLALGTVQAGVDPFPVSWALLELLRQRGLQVQCFHSRACFVASGGARSITGSAPRHLDSWLFSPESCRELFAHGAARSDLALVKGCFRCAGGELGGTLDDVCAWLDLPAVGIVDVGQWGDCVGAERPSAVSAVILDGVLDEADGIRRRTQLESLWGLPVWGCLPRCAGMRKRIEAIEAGESPPEDLTLAMAEALRRDLRVDRLLELAGSRPWQRTRPRLFPQATERPGRPRLAVAYDEAFNCYLPDNLDLLEAHGVDVADFSPLRDERLPPDVDAVVIGCGHPARHAAALAENDCLKLALRQYVHAGGCVYAEGSGAAYLAHRLMDKEGRCWPMAALLSVEARELVPQGRPVAVETRLARDTWLAPAGSVVRGYRGGNWRFELLGEGEDGALDGGAAVLFGRPRVVGNVAHVHLAAHFELLERFSQGRRV